MALRKIASFWKADGPGKTFLRGNADREGVTLPPNAKLKLFINDKGDNPKRPDYTLHLAEEDGTQPTAPQETQRGEIWGGQAPASDLSDDETPF